jgi:hypothetical protein
LAADRGQKPLSRRFFFGKKGSDACGMFRWIVRSGKLRTMALPEGWLAVELSQELPLPNTSWMDEPWPRTKFTPWIG